MRTRSSKNPFLLIATLALLVFTFDSVSYACPGLFCRIRMRRECRRLRRQNRCLPAPIPPPCGGGCPAPFTPEPPLANPPHSGHQSPGQFAPAPSGNGGGSSNSPRRYPAPPSSSSQQQNGSESETERRIIELTNRERTRLGLTPLTVSPNLMRESREKSRNMQQRNSLSHDLPPQVTNGAENIAQGQRTAEEVVNSWMQSPGHRANILNPRLRSIGVGRSGDFWTQRFGWS